MLPIAVDAMGGDRSPGEIVEGAKQAAAAGIPIVLVGPADLASRVDIGDLPLIAASEVIAMDEDPAGGVRRKKDSTLVRAAEAVRDGTASAMISAGNTGATMASALLRMGRIKGVNRPAIATPIPVIGLDADDPPRRRRQRRGAAGVAGAVRPDGRGLRPPPLRDGRARRSACCRSARRPARATRCARRRSSCSRRRPRIDFIGNVEGRDILTEAVDVVVTDGFTGNVVLKSLEGCVMAVVEGVRRRHRQRWPTARTPTRCCRRSAPLYATLDPDTYGGAVLLGVDGVCVISHGSTGATAMLNGDQGRRRDGRGRHRRRAAARCAVDHARPAVAWPADACRDPRRTGPARA